MGNRAAIVRRLIVIIIGVIVAVAAMTPATPAAAATAAAAAPPQNPFLAPNPFSNIHDDTWMSNTYAIAGPRAGAQTFYRPAPLSLCGTLTFDHAGQIVSVCFSLSAPPQARLIDRRTLRVLGTYNLPAGPLGPVGYQSFGGGGYFFLDQRDRLWTTTRTGHLVVLAIRGRTFSKVADYNLNSVLRPGQQLTSALPDFRGRIWFVSKQGGVVGVLNPRTRRIRATHADSEIENSFAVGRDGVYIVSERSIYRFGVTRGGRPVVRWRMRYRNSGIHKPGQVDAGSGTTPTILPRGYVAITDNADPMDVVVYRTAPRLPRGQRRVVCQVPVFHRGASDTENSLIGSGRSLIVENNYGYQGFSGPQANALTAPGFARVQIGRDGRGCRRVWQTFAQRAPSVVPKLSTATGLIYTYTRNPGSGVPWRWVALSFATGRTVFKIAAANGLTGNNNYAGIVLGPSGDAYLPTIGGIRELRRR